MKRSDLNHLRRVVAWVRVEVGQTPEVIVTTAKSVADGLGNLEMSDAAKLRPIDSYDRARSVPKYVREAVATLSKYLETEGPVVDEAAQNSSADSALSAREVPKAVQIVQVERGKELRTEHLVVEADHPGLGEVPIAVLFNPYCGPRRTYSIAIKPFPWESFPPHSPWEDDVVIGWNDAAEQVAVSCGHSSVEAYVKSEIRKAVAMHQQGKGAGA